MARLSMAKIDTAINQFGKAVVKRARGNLTRSKRGASRSLWKSIRYRYKKGKLQFQMNYYGAFIDQGVTGHGKGGAYKSGGKAAAKGVQRSVHSPPYKFTKGPVGPEAERSFAEWIRTKGIKPRNAMGQFVKITPNSLSSLNFLLRRAVGRYGIEATEFFSEAFSFYAPGLEKEIEFIVSGEIDKAISQDLDRNITKHCKV